MADPLFINASAGAPAYSANELRQGMALALQYNGRAVGGRQGVRPGGDQLLTTLAGSTITVKAGIAALDPGLTTTQGPYWVAIPVDETHPLTAADATNPRKDITILRVYDHDEDASGLRLARTEYIAGTPAPTPAEPAVPPGAMRLALIDVPASGGGSAVVTDRRPWTVAPGGILPVSLAGDIAAAVEGRYRDRLDTNVLERDSGSAWETIADPSIFKAAPPYTVAWTASPTNPNIGNGTLSGRSIQIGKLVHVWVQMLAGSTTTFGSGTWQFSLPATRNGSFSRHGGGGLVVDSSVPQYYPIGLRGTSSVVNVVVGGGVGAGLAASNSPFAWATGDELDFHFCYEAL